MRIIFFLFLLLTQGMKEKSTTVVIEIEKQTCPVAKTCTESGGSCSVEKADQINDSGLLLARLFSNS